MPSWSFYLICRSVELVPYIINYMYLHLDTSGIRADRGRKFQKETCLRTNKGKELPTDLVSTTPYMSRDRASQSVRESYIERRQRNRNSLLRFVFFCVPGFTSRLECILRLTRKVTIQVRKILRLPRRVTLQLHQILRLGYLSKPHFGKMEVGQWDS